ncbi:hypothetical protein [Curtobacterium sp. ISL-83]|uniref:hypothetical protein n=1 Tax=Curtobacterium sp. ISL-83 TaxID=2819145 RepID=UPI001BEB2758|nr:hypothetical protein [Curtobacterium sp. ISL-83]MBT2502183.1 hypothetical protein [Curtobacterium sp. ISL-83]
MHAETALPAELSEAERGIVIASLGAGRPGTYDIAFTLAFRSGVDVPRLRDAVRGFAAANPWTRRRYTRDGRSLRAVLHDAPVVVEDGSDVMRTPLDVLGGPLVRFGLTSQLGTGTVHLDVRIHHSLADGIAVALVLRALLDTYRTGQAPVLPFGLADPVVAAALVDRRLEEAFTAAVVAKRTDTGRPTRVTFDCPDRAPADFTGGVVLALARWTGVEGVCVASPVLGRRLEQMGHVGSFVRTVLLEFPRTTGTAADLGNAAVTALRQEAFSGRSTLRPVRFPVVMVDRKTTSMLDRELDRELDVVLLDDPFRQTRKYPLHVSSYGVRGTQTITIEGDGFPPGTVEVLADLIRSELTLATTTPRTTAPETTGGTL